MVRHRRRRRGDEGIDESLRRIILDRVAAAGFDDDSDPVAVQARLDHIAAEINDGLGDLVPDVLPGFTLTYKGAGQIVVGLRGES